MIFPPTASLALLGIYDRGKPNLERIVLTTFDDVSLGSYFLAFARKSSTSRLPLNNLFWLGDLDVSQGTYIHVYTGPGSHVSTTLPSGVPVEVLHLGFDNVIFLDTSLEPMILNVSEVAMLPGS